MTERWNLTEVELPPEGVPVDTMIHDEHGTRNECPLIRDGRLWFFVDRSMYVYYRPTHWKLRTEATNAH